ncbi:hypothetical protein Tco_0744635 [Tanacetum coccineum]
MGAFSGATPSRLGLFAPFTIGNKDAIEKNKRRDGNVGRCFIVLYEQQINMVPRKADPLPASLSLKTEATWIASRDSNRELMVRNSLEQGCVWEEVNTMEWKKYNMVPVAVIMSYIIDWEASRLSALKTKRIFKKKAKNDQTKHGMEKPKSVKVKSQPHEENTT